VSRPVRRYVKAVASLVFLVLIAAACSSDGFPESYADQIDEDTGVSNVEQNWLDGCTLGFDASDLADDANNVCACSYTAISGEGGIAFEDFVALDNELKGDPESLANSESLTATESQLLDIVKSCIAGS
jgi:hypothetical protein